MKEKDNIRHGDVDDMIFGSEAHGSDRLYANRLRFRGAFSHFYNAFSIVPPPRTSSPS